MAGMGTVVPPGGVRPRSLGAEIRSTGDRRLRCRIARHLKTMHGRSVERVAVSHRHQLNSEPRATRPEAASGRPESAAPPRSSRYLPVSYTNLTMPTKEK